MNCLDDAELLSLVLFILWMFGSGFVRLAKKLAQLKSKPNAAGQAQQAEQVSSRAEELEGEELDAEETVGETAAPEAAAGMGARPGQASQRADLDTESEGSRLAKRILSQVLGVDLGELEAWQRERGSQQGEELSASEQAPGDDRSAEGLEAETDWASEATPGEFYQETFYSSDSPPAGEELQIYVEDTGASQETVTDLPVPLNPGSANAPAETWSAESLETEEVRESTAEGSAGWGAGAARARSAKAGAGVSSPAVTRQRATSASRPLAYCLRNLRPALLADAVVLYAAIDLDQRPSCYRPRAWHLPTGRR